MEEEMEVIQVSEKEQRAKVVDAGASYVGAPYHHLGMSRSGGVDCATLIYLAYVQAGLIAEDPIEFYPQDWHLHRGVERYLERVLTVAEEVPLPPDRTPQPGDVVLWKFGRCFSHGALVVEWPRVVHAYIHKTVEVVDTTIERYLTLIGERCQDQGKVRPMRVFRLKGWVE